MAHTSSFRVLPAFSIRLPLSCQILFMRSLRSPVERLQPSDRFIFSREVSVKGSEGMATDLTLRYQ